MGTTLSHGYKLPTNGDRGSSFYPDLAENIQLSNSHNHDGEDGEQVEARFLAKQFQVLLAANWEPVADQDGTYRQLVTFPDADEKMLFETTEMRFLINSGDEIHDPFHPSVEWVTNRSFYVYINDNSVAVKIIYG